VLQRTARCCAKTVPKVYGIEAKGVLLLSESRRPELMQGYGKERDEWKG